MNPDSPRAPSNPRRRPWPPFVWTVGLGAIAAFTATGAFYPLLRFVQFLLFKDPDPRAIIFSEHSGFYWRCLISAYLGGMVGILTGLAAAREPARVVRWLARVVLAVIALVLVQGLWLP